MLKKFQIQCVIVLAIIFCFLFKIEAAELDPIAAQHIFTTKNSIIVPIEKLRPSEKITPEGTAEAMYFMKKRISGEQKEKRQPLDVIERGDGNYTIIDGNRSFAALKELGAKNLPVIVHPLPYQKDVKNLKQLYALNLAAEDEYNNLMDDLQKNLGGELLKRSGIKKEKRVREKAKLEYNGDYSAITDMWAATLVFPDEKSLLNAFDELKKRDDVIWTNDRWNNPLPQGYKDVQLCIILSNGAICELQLHHKAVMEVNHTLDHYVYEFRRSNFKNSKMKSCVERALNFQKFLYETVWDGRYSQLDAETKKLLSETAKKLATEKSPINAEILLKRLEDTLRNNLPEEYNIAA